MSLRSRQLAEAEKVLEESQILHQELLERATCESSAALDGLGYGRAHAGKVSAFLPFLRAPLHLSLGVAILQKV